MKINDWLILNLYIDLYETAEKYDSQTVGFEPTLPEGIRFRVERLNQLGHICISISAVKSV